MIQTEENISVQQFLLKDDGTYPNNPALPVFHYKNVWQLPDEGASDIVEKQFKANQWGNAWRNGVYNFHHYHSTAHEVLGIYKGATRILIGGNKGVVLRVEMGDVLIIPAGVAHKNLDANMGFKCVGAYPKGQAPDINYGLKTERPAADKRIEAVELPKTDPVFGTKGPMLKFWKG